MENHAEILFILNTVFVENEDTGTVTAFYAQWPQASAEGRTKEEAKTLLREIFAVMMEENAKEYIDKFHNNIPSTMSIEEEKVFA